MGTEIICVVAALIARNGKILITQRGAEDPLAGQWEFPGGKIEAGETPQQCLAREIEEELGIVVSVGAHIGTHIHHYDHISIELSGYRANILSGTPTLTEHADLRWVDWAELKRFDLCAADRFLLQKDEK